MTIDGAGQDDGRSDTCRLVHLPAEGVRSRVEDRRVAIGNRSIMVRDAGDRDGQPVLYFHGTPGSRLDGLVFEADLAGVGVRLLSFDRPGYGRSDPAPFGLGQIGEVAGVIADHFGLDSFVSLGWSGGGPFALAAGAVLGDRVRAVGVANGPGPFQRVPNALEELDATSIAALSRLPDDPEGAVEQFCAGSEPMMSVLSDERTFMAGMEAVFTGPADAAVLADPALRHHLYLTMSEGLRQGFTAVGRDNAAWVGPWDISLDAVRCPVLLWYGEDDRSLPIDHGVWLADQLPSATLVTHSGEGHLSALSHWELMLRALTDTCFGP